MASIAEKQTTPDDQQLAVTPKSTSHSSSDADAPIDPKAERRLLWKLDLCIYPPLFVIYTMSFLDRINISNARILGMTEEIDLGGNRFSVALFVSASQHTKWDSRTRIGLTEDRSTSFLTFSSRCPQTC